MPGWPIRFLTYAEKRRLRDAVALTEDTRRKLASLFKNLPREFPAKLTAWDTTTSRASWSLQTYGADGRRRDAFDTVTGSPTYAPAYPVGNGIMPPPAFPVEVWMRFRVETATVGPTYEFDWACACDSVYSGSGAGTASKVTVDCAPQPVETVWSAVVSVTSGSCANWDGVTFNMVYVGDETWRGTGVAADGVSEVAITAACVGGDWGIGYVSGGPDALTGGTLLPPSGSPVEFSWSGVTAPGCPGALISITVTET